MKFLYSDTHDYVDPRYDFLTDRNGVRRKRYWDDVYAHELMTPAPYDGLLVAMSAVVQAAGIPRSKVRYSTAEKQRLVRDGARKFLRLHAPDGKHPMLMGDCGAFAYAELATPAFTPSEVFEFYVDAEFTHGVSPDHIIFECDASNPSRSAISQTAADRYDLTLQNAEAFLAMSRADGNPFEPLGAVQGWSPASMGAAALELERMGYSYLAIGGLVPLKPEMIHEVLKAIRSVIKASTNIHLLGFAKAEQIQEFTGYGISSFDSTSPLIRAFKDAKANYYLPGQRGKLSYYAAIRIPQAIENPRLLRGIKSGAFSAEDLQRRETGALLALREYDGGSRSLESTLDAVTDYQGFLLEAEAGESKDIARRALEKARASNARTLADRPWKQCACSICREIGVEVIIFRSSNRNKRRGFHNLGVYHQHLKKTLEASA